MSLRLLSTHTVDIIRKTSDGYFSGGKFHYKIEQLSIQCSRQPITGKDQQYFEAFAQNLERLKIWTKSSIPVLVDDIILHKGVRYRVFRVQDYTEFNLKIDNNEVYAIEASDDY